MQLKPVSFLDIAVFLLFTVFYLIRDSRWKQTISCGLRALPFLFFTLPYGLINERYRTRTEHQLAITRRISLFQDVMLRCIRWGFINVPCDVGKLFFIKGVSLPYLRFRMWRSGCLRPGKDCPKWTEIKKSKKGMRGLWISYDTTIRPDFIVYYVHGGGFAMGSTYFYLEFLMTWLSVLKELGVRNPAIFAIEYTLIPQECHPHQLHETLQGYSYVLSRIQNSGKVVVAGDSAGGLLVLSMLLYLGSKMSTEIPVFAALISPWTNLVMDKHRTTDGDFLEPVKLNEYGRIYAGPEDPNNPLLSPGVCKDVDLWTASFPVEGIGFYHGGSEELLGPEIEKLSRRLSKVGRVINRVESNVHAWPVAAMFLEPSARKRRKALLDMSIDITAAVDGSI
ncbi:Alpha/Beta hydrolase protein [Pyronema omphalodes]|nr:Alpha/Beta hydrolase protein [Pyronema omphalodes]